MINSADFAKRLQKILFHYGISATAFSEKIEVNRSTISHLLSGRNKPSLEFVMKVLEEFPEVELYWLLNGKGSFPSEKKITSQGAVQKNTTRSQEKLQASETPAVENSIRHSNSKKEIERIVIFYKDGSFEAYDH